MKPAACLASVLLATSVAPMAWPQPKAEVATPSTGQDEPPPQRWRDDGDTTFDGEASAADESLPALDERPEHPLAFAPHQDVWMVPSLSYRLRYYHREGKDFQNGTTADLLRHRARLGLEVSYRELVGAFVQLQDVRTFGEERDPVTDYSADGVDLHQAYARLTPGDWDMKLGRQELALLNQRLLGKLDFAEQGRAFDGISVALSREQARLDLIWALVRDDSAQPTAAQPTAAQPTAAQPTAGATDPAAPPADGKRHLGALHVGHQGLRGLQPHILAIVEGDTTSELLRITAGALIEGNLGKGIRFDYGAEGYYQWAKDGGGMRTHAYLFSVRSRAVAEIDSEPSIELHVTWISGDEDPEDGVVRTFTSPYPTGHAFHGEMDVFTAFPADTRERGLRDAGLTLAWTPVFTTWSAALHFFDATAYRTDDYRSHFGWEMDFKARMPLYAPYFTMDAVYAFFNPGELMIERSADPSLEHFAYVTATMAF